MHRKYLSDAIEDEMESLTRSLCKEHFPKEAEVVVKWGYSKNFLGLATISLMDWRSPTIVYSRRTLDRRTHSDRIETVYHEVSHQIVFYNMVRIWHEGGATPGGLCRLMDREGEHGPMWRSQMIKFGYHKC